MALQQVGARDTEHQQRGDQEEEEVRDVDVDQRRNVVEVLLGILATKSIHVHVHVHVSTGGMYMYMYTENHVSTTEIQNVDIIIIYTYTCTGYIYVTVQA